MVERGKDRMGEEKRERKKKVRKKGEGLDRELSRVPAGKCVIWEQPRIL